MERARRPGLAVRAAGPGTRRDDHVTRVHQAQEVRAGRAPAAVMGGDEDVRASAYWNLKDAAYPRASSRHVIRFQLAPQR